MRNQAIITQRRADLNGDGIPESIRLTGIQEAGSVAWQEIRLEIQDGATCQKTVLIPQQDAGYDPRLWIGRLTGDSNPQVLLSIQSGGSGGIGYDTIYGWKEGNYLPLFTSDAYNAEFSYAVAYLDGYTVEAVSLENHMKYFIDLSGRDKAYLSQIYRPDGSLIKPTAGGVDPLSVLYPVDFDGDGQYELLAYQRITGLYHADGLGDFINLLGWDGRRFGLVSQSVGIFGTDVGS